MPPVSFIDTYFNTMASFVLSSEYDTLLLVVFKLVGLSKMLKFLPIILLVEISNEFLLILTMSLHVSGRIARFTVTNTFLTADFLGIP